MQKPKTALMLGLAMLAGSTLASMGDAEARDRHVRVLNASNDVLVVLQASNVTRRTWEEDILGHNVLFPGQATLANLNDGSGQCLFDMRAIFRSGRQEIRRNVDICRVKRWTITD